MLPAACRLPFAPGVRRRTERCRRRGSYCRGAPCPDAVNLGAWPPSQSANKRHLSRQALEFRVNHVEFAAGASDFAPQTVPAHPEEDVTEQSVAAIVADRILRFGDRGSDVRAVQRALARLGYGLSGTGNYGANTQAAVADFQAKHGLELDAEVGPETAKAIDAVVASARKSADGTATPLSLPEPPRPSEPPPIERSGPASASQTLAASVGDRILRTGDAGDLVRAIQFALTKLGYDLKGTGNYGARTQSAVADSRPDMARAPR